MPIYFTPPVEDPTLAMMSLLRMVPRLDGIMCTFRRDCMETAREFYNEIATKNYPCVTDLFHEFQNGKREDASDLEVDFPEFDPPFGQSETCKIGGKVEDIAMFEHRIAAGVRVARQFGERVLIVAPSSVIQHWAGVTLKPGEVYEYSDDVSYYARCLLELKEWREETTAS